MRFLSNRLLKHSYKWEQYLIDNRNGFRGIASNDEVIAAISGGYIVCSYDCCHWVTDLNCVGGDITHGLNNQFAVANGRTLYIVYIDVVRQSGFDPYITILPMSTDVGNLSFVGIAYGNGYYIAVGNNGVTARYDCATDQWTTGTILNKNYTNHTLRNVVFNNGTFVAVSQEGVVFSSNNNGETWTIIKSDIAGDVSSEYQIENINYVNGKYVITGYGRVDGQIGVGLIISSDDLSIFAIQTFDKSPLHCVGYFNDTYFLCGRDIYRSTDFQNWTGLNAPYAADYMSIGFLNNKLVAGADRLSHFISTKRIG